MKATSQTQFEKEHSKWQKILEDFRQKNALLKYRLSEIVDDNEDKNFLQMAEYFQNELLLKDEMLKKLMKQLQGFTGMIENKQMSDENINAKQEKLHVEILQFQKKYLNLSKKFNEKMMQNL